MKVVEIIFGDCILLSPEVYGDDRGFFQESYNVQTFAKLGINEVFVQDNHSKSTKGVLRGLHFQYGKPQGKLIRVVSGEVLDVIVDIRKGSPSFGKWRSVTLSAENKMQLFIPKGFAHGLCVVSETADFLYKCTDYYDPETEITLAWDDPDLGIEWPLDTVKLSEKDKKGLRLNDIPSQYLLNWKKS